jgi:DNA-binding response OmpR family regulator
MEPTRLRVLVADDDPAIRELLAFNLEAEGFDVVGASNGEEAWDVARNAAPDLVVLDVMMPDRDGLDVLACLRGNPRTRDIPVVLLTAKANDSDVWAGWQAGADYYVTKPFVLDELMRFIEFTLRPGSTQSA